VVPGVSEAIMKSRGKLVFVMNLMTKKGESYGYSASMYLEDMQTYLPLSRFDYVIMNTDQHINQKLLVAYKLEGAEIVRDDLVDGSYHVVRAKLLSHTKIVLEKGDNVIRSMVRHDSKKLAKELVKLLMLK